MSTKPSSRQKVLRSGSKKTFFTRAQCAQIFCGFVTSARPKPPHSMQRGKAAALSLSCGRSSSADMARLDTVRNVGGFFYVRRREEVGRVMCVCVLFLEKYICNLSNRLQRTIAFSEVLEWLWSGAVLPTSRRCVHLIEESWIKYAKEAQVIFVN